MNGNLKESETHVCALSELQRAFQSAILHPQDKPPPFIVNAPKASAAERFAVYAKAYRLRLIEALAADYPALKEWLGDKAFDRLGRTYADTCPSGHFSIRWFGGRLPGFLAETPAYQNQPALKELAAFEWALSEAFDAAESQVVTETQLAALEPALWPDLKLRIHPSLRTIDLAYNTPGRWQALNRKEPVPDLETRSEITTWAVWRYDLRLLFRSLPKTEARALNAFSQGHCFAEVCEALCEWLDDTQVAVNAAGYLRTWLREGWIAGIKHERGVPSPILRTCQEITVTKKVVSVG
ncbi:MAG: DNA-binding domain-containing protein [Methylococcales bacterium]